MFLLRKEIACAAIYVFCDARDIFDFDTLLCPQVTHTNDDGPTRANVIFTTLLTSEVHTNYGPLAHLSVRGA